uniref:uncharacterized protein LOC122603548 isoform X2 n=1 Tax=Erigeron canadensis TaxID=72917 RepID=UPI001CB90450|nr:uncharacterized protein LOC122603548 isoform X2 [Erigeron canadensis]
MEGMENISQYRDRLDQTVMSSDLSNVENLKILVESQMSESIQSEDQDCRDKLVQKRTKEVANFLSMLRSASGKAVKESKVNETPSGGWKIKHDNQECRVMYREGPAGTPFHTLLVEGYVDGPLDVCMCISWEAGLYQKWWPQFNIPTFKVLFSECVKNIGMGEQISLVRMKLSWPVSAREALVHYVTLNYYQDDLVIVLLNTVIAYAYERYKLLLNNEYWDNLYCPCGHKPIQPVLVFSFFLQISETEDISKSTHGFTRDGIPDVGNVIRMDVVGGLALQKVSANRSYFRAIANMDVKLDFVPPAIINFVSRQLIGSGFKLFKKEVASVTKGDEDFSEALKKPFYGRIREALYSENNVPNGVSKQKDVDIYYEAVEQNDIKIVDEVLEQETDNIGQPEEHCTSKIEVNDQTSICEIEEVEETERSHENSYSNRLLYDDKKQVVVSPEVNQALGTLEKVITIFREFGFNPRSLSFSRFVNNVFADLEDNKSYGSKHFVNELTARKSKGSRNSYSSHSSRHKDFEVGLASPEDDTSGSRKTHRSSFSFVINEAINSTSAENNATNGKLENGLPKKKVKKQRFCCLNFTSGRLVS